VTTHAASTRIFVRSRTPRAYPHARSPSGATSTIYPADANGRRKIVARGPSGAVAVTYVDADDVPDVVRRAERERSRDGREIDKIIEMKAVGLPPE
jgi:hypothetical protein